ncbi:MAG: glycosyltransferase family 4 protein [Candidatus Devosia phytovorans]|uniref:Glycosyltransferase family 4 protein n=1 Tax=Candidatus Devosia phytovorans TaxID=3121372 RepID=A0AAJ6AZ19_9HYPH|nr:glycosyltransferase family 4 protein [Devosia sp.]WEK03637.1 MAG: glycosyltransferase family 4 protein [Devosia sp.]
MTGAMRVATISHGHPALSPGGAEIAALTLHTALAELDGVEALHLAAAPPTHPGIGGELFATGRLDGLTLLQREPGQLDHLLTQLTAFQPQVIHLHHILGIGADALFGLRQRFPDATILLTLHEFIAICHNRGQMMKTDGTACERSSASDCASCFPEITAARFLRRERALRAMLSLLDGFIAPSAFLAQRYVEWGVPASRIITIENAVPLPAPVQTRRDSRPGKRGRFAFFGQMTPFKGIDVLLEAVASLSDADWQGSTLDIHGAHLELQPADFQNKIAALIDRAGARVTLHGAYDSVTLPALMRRADWVVVPSIWWENSPLVIQEAFSQGLPVIASAIGGMAEKVAHGRNGLTFTAGDSAALAETLMRAADPSLWASMRAGVVPPTDAATIAHWHRRLYQSLLQGRMAPAQAV